MPEDLLLLIEALERENDQCALVEGNSSQNWDKFVALFKMVEAAGGLVQNQHAQWLFIYRNGMWDLPKGKREKTESIEDCAVREVAEECGIAEPTIVKQLTTTFHTYTLYDQRILKPTYWFLMRTEDDSTLTPQKEEGISSVKWVPSSEAAKLAEESYGSIKQVVTEGLN